MVGCLLFCVDVTDGAQQCSVLQVISAGFGCWFFSVFSFSQTALSCTFITSYRYTLLPGQKNTLVTFL